MTRAGVVLTEEQRMARNDANRRYYERNKEKVAEKNARYRAENKERVDAARREWQRENRERVNATRKAWRKADPERTRRSYRADGLRSKYGITLADYDDMLRKQSGVCAICLGVCSTGRRLAVDHDHTSGAVRGLLCADCNRGIGMFDDEPDRLRAAAAYLSEQVV